MINDFMFIVNDVGMFVNQFEVQFVEVFKICLQLLMIVIVFGIGVQIMLCLVQLIVQEFGGVMVVIVQVQGYVIVIYCSVECVGKVFGYGDGMFKFDVVFFIDVDGGYLSVVVQVV